jgi:hypothetical protein
MGKLTAYTLRYYGLDDRAIEVRSRQRQEDFSSSLCVQTGYGAHPEGYRGHFPGIKHGGGVMLTSHHIWCLGRE